MDVPAQQRSATGAVQELAVAARGDGHDSQLAGSKLERQALHAGCGQTLKRPYILLGHGLCMSLDPFGVGQQKRPRLAAADLWALRNCAIDQPPDTGARANNLLAGGWAVHTLTSAAVDRATCLRRPDLGRRLAAQSAQALLALMLPPPDLALVLADGLSATAAHQHGAALLSQRRKAVPGTLRLSPVFLATQARLALSDEVGEVCSLSLTKILVEGQRPCFSWRVCAARRRPGPPGHQSSRRRYPARAPGPARSSARRSR